MLGARSIVFSRTLKQADHPDLTIEADAVRVVSELRATPGKDIALFCDGHLMASKPCRGALTKNDEPLLIGAETQGTKVARHFHGELEEAAFWSRALNDEEISLLSRGL